MEKIVPESSPVRNPYMQSKCGGSSRSQAIDAVRGLAIIGVFFLHDRFFARGNDSYRAYADAFAVVFDWSVIAFFFLSGLLSRRQGKFIESTKRNFVRLMLPFFLFNVFYNLAFLSLAGLGCLPSAVVKLGEIWTWPFVSPAFQLYFLPFLFVSLTAVQASMCLPFSRTARGLDIALVCLILLVLAFYGLAGCPSRANGNDLLLLPLYTAGVAYGMLLQGRTGRVPAILFSLGGMAGMAGWAVISASAVSTTCLALFVPHLLLVFFEKSKTGAVRGALAWLGQRAGGIYLWHTPLLMPVVNILLSMAGLHGLDLLLLTAVFSLIGATVLTLATRRLLPENLRFLALVR